MKHYLIRLPPEAFVKIGFNLSGSCSLLDWSPFCCKYSIHVCLILVFFLSVWSWVDQWVLSF